MPTWPTELPQSPLLDNYDETFQQEFIRSEMDAGPVKQRRRFSASSTHIRASLIVTSSQLDDLRFFYDIDILGGSLAFSWVHPRTSEAVSMRFVSPYSISPISGNIYRVTMELEILP